MISSIAWSITFLRDDEPFGRVVVAALAIDLGEVQPDLGEDPVQEVLQR